MIGYLESISVGLVTSFLCSGLLEKSNKAPRTTDSLYSRLGGYDAIAAVVDNFIGRLASDPTLARFFQGSSTDSRRHRRQLIVEQLCEAAGGPCYYTGRSMKASHEGLGVSEEDWGAMMQHLLEAFDEFQVPPKEREELISIVSCTKADIVEASKTSERQQ